MASGVTNKGKAHMVHATFRRTSLPTNYYVALVTSATAPDVDTNTLSELTEIAAGNGYTSGGYSLTPGATDFDTLTEDDTADEGYTRIKDVVFTASGGALPSSGSGASYAVLTDDNGTVGSREVYAWWDLSAAQSVTSGQTLTLQDLEVNLG